MEKEKFDLDFDFLGKDAPEKPSAPKAQSSPTPAAPADNHTPFGFDSSTLVIAAIGVALLFIIIAVTAGGDSGGSADTTTNTLPPPSTIQIPNETPGTTGEPQVQGQDNVVGDGIEAVPGATVSVLYVGMLEDGTVFDSSANNNNEPLTFTLGDQGLIPGFQIGVNGMREGGERRISVPPELGYGSEDIKDANGKIIIPANSTLIFDIKLQDVIQ